MQRQELTLWFTPELTLWFTPRQVGVTLVRELYGVMTAEGATDAILVTCGEYTDDAREFAAGKPTRLIHGETLVEIIRSVQPRGSGRER